MKLWKFWKRAAASIAVEVQTPNLAKPLTAIDILAAYAENCRLTAVMIGMGNTAHLNAAQKVDSHRRYEAARAEYRRAQTTLEQALAERGGE